MKKFICIISALILCTASLTGCGNSQAEKNESSVTGNDESSVVQNLISSEISESSTDISSSIVSEDEEPSEEEMSLPEGVTKTPSGNLQYKNSVLSLSVTFPSEFCMLETSYTPPYGIYLKNLDGTATLQLESTVEKNVTVEDFAESLKKQDPDSEVYITDAKDVICKRKSVDRSGNDVAILMKIRIKNGGYNDAVIYCKPEEKEKYEKLFKKINFS